MLALFNNRILSVGIFLLILHAYIIKWIYSEMKNNWLNDCKKDYFSQNGEDGIIEKILEIIQPDDNWCVEFGA